MQFILTALTFVTACCKGCVLDEDKVRNFIIILRKSQVWPLINWVDDLHEDL